MDNYYLNNAVYLVEDFLKSTKNPPYDGEVDYGDRAEHCWNGDHTRPNAISRLRYHQMFAPKIVERIEKSARRGRPQELAVREANPQRQRGRRRCHGGSSSWGGRRRVPRRSASAPRTRGRRDL